MPVFIIYPTTGGQPKLLTQEQAARNNFAINNRLFLKFYKEIKTKDAEYEFIKLQSHIKEHSENLEAIEKRQFDGRSTINAVCYLV